MTVCRYQIFFMPPLYPFFLYLIKIPINDTEIFLNTVFSIQLIISIISIFLCYKIFLEIFSESISLLGTLIFTVFPLNIYAISQISSITLQVLLINIFLLSFIKIFRETSKINYLTFSVASALLILLRGEFFIFVLLALFYLLITRKNSQYIFNCLTNCSFNFSLYLS